MSEDRRSDRQAPSIDQGRSASGDAREDGGHDATAQTVPLSGRGSTAIDDARTDEVRTDDVRTDDVRPDGTSGGPARLPRGARETGPAWVAPPRPGRSDTRPTAATRPAPRRKARLAITRVDPWSVFVLSLLVSIFLGIVLVVAVFVLYTLLSSLGVLDSVNGFAEDLQVIDPGASIVRQGQVLGVAAVLAAVDVVLLTVLATLGAFLYNVCASLTGGIEVALAERE